MKTNHKYFIYVVSLFFLIGMAIARNTKDKVITIREKMKIRREDGTDELMDVKHYKILDRPGKETAYKILRNIKKSLSTLLKHMDEKFGRSEIMVRTMERFDETDFHESSNEHGYNTFTSDKGDTLVFCMRKNGTGDFHDMNTLMFVALHEFAHIYSTTYHHTPEFWRNFKMILHEAVEIGIYKPVDYSKTPMRYCKMDITDNPMFINDV